VLVSVSTMSALKDTPETEQASIDSHYNYHDDKQQLKVRSWQLTYSNIVLQAVHYARINRLTGSFKDVIMDMITKSNWSPCIQMVRRGLSDYYHNQFEYKMGRKDDIDRSWMIPKQQRRQKKLRAAERKAESLRPHVEQCTIP
jgi:hypothetical protein